MADVEIDLDFDALWQEAMALPQVEAATMATATRIATRARAIALREGGKEVEISIQRHYLPNGRMALDVVSTDPSEHGSSEAKRIRMLQRAAREIRGR